MKNKDKYNLTKLTFKIEGENNTSQVFKILDGTNVVFEKPILLNRAHLSLFLSWLEEENVPDILTDKEKAYLSAVIKPYRQNVTGIKKGNIQGYSQEWITIEYSDETSKTYGYRIATLPNFKFGTMYKGMEANKVYTLKELGL